MTDGKTAALEYIRATCGNTLAELFSVLIEQCAELHAHIVVLEDKVGCLESYCDVATKCVHWTKDDVAAVTEKLRELDSRTVGLLK